MSTLKRKSEDQINNPRTKKIQWNTELGLNIWELIGSLLDFKSLKSFARTCKTLRFASANNFEKVAQKMKKKLEENQIIIIRLSDAMVSAFPGFSTQHFGNLLIGENNSVYHVSSYRKITREGSYSNLFHSVIETANGIELPPTEYTPAQFVENLRSLMYNNMDFKIKLQTEWIEHDPEEEEEECSWCQMMKVFGQISISSIRMCLSDKNSSLTKWFQDFFEL